jgi:hypothetical protein
MSAAEWHSADELIDRCFAVDPAVRYVAVYLHGEPTMRQRPGITGASAGETDRYEEPLVNPTLLTLARRRGEIDCGGLEWLLIRYGNFFTFLQPTAEGHVNVELPLEGRRFHRSILSAPRLDTRRCS